MKKLKKYKWVVIGLLIIIFVVIAVGIWRLSIIHNQQAEFPTTSPLSRGDADFEKRYGMTRVEFNQHWDASDGYMVVYNKDYNSELSNPLETKLLSINRFNIYKQSLGKGNKDFFNYLVSNGVNLKPIDDNIFTDRYSKPDYAFEYRFYIELPNHEIQFIDNQDNFVSAIAINIFNSPVKTDIADLLGKPQIEFKDRLTPGEETKFYPQLGMALYINHSDYRYQLYVFKPQMKLDDEFIKTIGLNGRNQAGNPNSYFLELPPTNK